MNSAPRPHGLIFEHWTKGGTGVTNFQLDRMEVYIEAVQRYGDRNLVVSDTSFGKYPNYGGSLHDLLKVENRPWPRRLSDFWDLFAEVEKELKRERKDVKLCR
jgi:hypothetical protein